MSPRTPKVLFAVAILIIVVLVMRNHGSSNAAGTRTIYRYTAQQAIDQSMPICMAILPDRAGLYIGAEPIRGGSSGEPIHVFWEVGISDSAGNQLLRILRDSNTGNIRQVSLIKLLSTSFQQSGKPALSSKQAVERAREWMLTLGLDEDWQLSSKPRVNAVYWNIELQAPHRNVYLHLDPHQGTLTFADIVPTR